MRAKDAGSLARTKNAAVSKDRFRGDWFAEETDSAHGRAIQAPITTLADDTSSCDPMEDGPAQKLLYRHAVCADHQLPRVRHRDTEGSPR